MVEGKNEKNSICGIIFQHGENDFSRWDSFSLKKEDENAIMDILKKYETDGQSIRGTLEDINNV